MTEQLIVDRASGIARIVETQTIAEAPLASLSKYLEVRMPSVFPVLPDDTKVVAFDPDNKRGVVMIEQKPTRHHIQCHFDQGEYRANAVDWAARNKTTNIADFPITLPYQIFAYSFTLDTKGQLDYRGQIADFTLQHGLLLWRPQPINSLDDKLWPARMLNVRDTHICWGYQKHDTASLASRLNDMIKSFPLTIFNTHYGMPTPSDYPNYTEWAKASEGVKGLTVYTDWEYFNEANSHLTIRKFIDKYLAKDIGVADMSQSKDDIPPPPERFTIGRMIEWFEALPANQKARFTISLQRALNNQPTLLEDALAQMKQTAPEEVVVAKVVEKTPKGAKAAKADDEIEIELADGKKVKAKVNKTKPVPTHAPDGTPLR